MHRRISTLILAVCTIVAFACIALARAQTSCEPVACVFVPMVRAAIMPSPLPTPVPPMLSDAVLHQSDLGSEYLDFTVETFREVPNSEAAKTYQNENAALNDFATQGRETSWLAQYSYFRGNLCYENSRA